MGGRSTLYFQYKLVLVALMFLLPREISTASIRRTVVTRVNTASLIFEGRLVLPVHVNAAITKGEANDSDSFKCLKGSYFGLFVRIGYEEELKWSFTGVRMLGLEVLYWEMITSQLQGKLWLYDEVRTRLCLFCHHQIGEDCWDS
ncbi:hypothetical protein Tco_1509388 [Tanacetum coccineum]